MITNYLINRTEKQLAILNTIKDATDKISHLRSEITNLKKLDLLHPYRINEKILEAEIIVHQAASIKLQRYYADVVQNTIEMIARKEIGYPVNVRIAELLA